MIDSSLRTSPAVLKVPSPYLNDMKLVAYSPKGWTIDEHSLPLLGGSHALIFVPGMGGSFFHAEAFLKQIDSPFEVVFGLDLLGFGVNKHLQGSLKTHQQQIRALRETVECLNLFQQFNKVSLISISLGCITSCLSFEKRWPWFYSTMMVSPAFKAHPGRFPLSYKLQTLFKRILNGPSAQLSLPYHLGDLTRDVGPWEQHEVSTAHPLTLPIDYLFSVDGNGPKASRVFSTIETPLLMAVPEQDTVCDPTLMKRNFQRIAETHFNNELLLFPEAYHDLFLETQEAARFSGAYLEWLQNLGKPMSEDAKVFR